MSSKLHDPAKLLVVLSILFALTLGGAPPSSESEISGDTEMHASAAVATAGSSIMNNGMGPIPLDVRLYTLLPNPQEEAPFTIQVERLLPLPSVPEEAIQAFRAEQAEKKPTVVTHVVKSGETAWDIAKAYGVDVDTIVGCNDLVDIDRLKVGQELKILTIKGVLHTVRQSESLWEIARDYKVDVDTIVQANNLTDPGRLQPKQELVIPGAKPRVIAGQQRRPLVANGRLQKAFEWPVHGPISSRFGRRWGRMHEGLDIAVNTGTPVKAAAAGKVTFAGWNGAYGYLVKIDHGNGVETRYAHNSRLLVKAGDKVTAGQVIARSGNTGRSTGPHVHFEIRLNGRAYNPLDYLR